MIRSRFWPMRPWLMLGLMALAALSLAGFNALNPARAAGDDADAGAVGTSAYGFAPLGQVAVYRPPTTSPAGPRGVVIALSDRGGWDDASAAFARRLAARGALVAGISTPQFLKALSGSKRCINPNVALIDLARDLQHRLDLPLYRKPILLGRGEGAALAYAALASGPNGSYAAALSDDFTPVLPGAGRWCRSGSLKIAAITRPYRGWVFAPSRQLPSPWVALSRGGLRRLPAFVARTDGRLLTRTAAQADTALLAQALPYLHVPTAIATLPPDLPITIVTDPAAPRTDMMAVLYSGDGGWVGLDRDVAGVLARRGIPVVGMDSLSYFWRQRTPQGAAADLSAIIHDYARQWQRPRILLVGYSFGADVLPSIVGHLPPAQRAQIQRLSLLGLSPTADFQFHLASWLGLDAGPSYPTIPAIAKLRGLPMLCIQGTAEKDSACPAIAAGLAERVVVPGGHHFDRNAPLLVDRIVQGVTI